VNSKDAGEKFDGNEAETLVDAAEIGVGGEVACSTVIWIDKGRLAIVSTGEVLGLYSGRSTDALSQADL